MKTAEQMLETLAQWRAADWLRPLDLAFVRFLHEQAEDASPVLLLAAALVSHQLGRGHSCLDLVATVLDPESVLSLPPGDDHPYEQGWDSHKERGNTLVLPSQLIAELSVDRWLAELTHPFLIGTGQDTTPLVLDQTRVYLRRYWQFERSVSRAIAQRVAQPAIEAPDELMRLTLASLFPESSRRTGPHWQKIACALAARRTFSVITGGPGTGKTTTVLRLLVLLQSMTIEQGHPPLEIRVAAPTGKAAARLNDSIANQIDALPLTSFGKAEAIAAAIPKEVTTLHRLLGTRRAQRRAQFHSANQLPIDALVIDEASMVDLEMMAAVLAALPDKARLILLGDKDQLASVEAGAILGELCQRADSAYYTPDTAMWLSTVAGQTLPGAFLDSQGSGLDQAVVMLRDSHRFAADSAIGQLAQAINNGAMPRIDDAAIDVPVPSPAAPSRSKPNTDQVTQLRLRDPEDVRFRDFVVDGYRRYLAVVVRGAAGYGEDSQVAEAHWAADVLAAHRDFQVLAALRHGPWGVVSLNERIITWLVGAGLIAANETWFAGRPVMIMRNDYSLGLMNGDVGIALPTSDQSLRIAFPANDGAAGIRWVSPLRLSEAQTVFVMTVHKSQGSEFGRVALVLPPGQSPLLTRELLYTGVTRAREEVMVVLPGGEPSLRHALQQRVRRASGLRFQIELE